MEVLHDLVGYQERKIYQNKEWFSFSLDSILLARFALPHFRDHRILDIGTGTAPIPLIFSLYTNASIDAVEIQQELVNLSKKSVEYNHLENQVHLFGEDIFSFQSRMESDQYDLIVCNPPYFDYQDHSFVNREMHKTLARHQVSLTLEQLLTCVRKLLKNGGRFAVVYPTSHLLDLLKTFSNYGIEPKRLQFVYPKRGKESNLCLLEGMKNGKTFLKVLPPLYIHNEDGSYTEDYLKYLTK